MPSARPPFSRSALFTPSLYHATFDVPAPDESTAAESDATGSVSAGYDKTSNFTSATPSRIICRRRAAFFDRSMMRPRLNGPRSLIRTTTEGLSERSIRVTRTRVPNGRLRWAAVRTS